MIWLAAALLFGVGLALTAMRLQARRRVEAAQLQAEVEAVRALATSEASTAAAALEAKGRSEALARRKSAQVEATQKAAEAAALEERLATGAAQLAEREGRLEQKRTTLEERETALAAIDQQKKDLQTERQKTDAERKRVLAELAQETHAEAIARLSQERIDEARAEAADRLRRVEGLLNDVSMEREAKRLLDVSMQRYQGHYLTERLLSNLPLPDGALEKLAGPDNGHFLQIEEIANIKLLPAEDGLSVRLDGQDSFGREIARRAIARFLKHGVRDVQKQTLQIKEDLEKEVFDLGRRAFKELEIPRAHPDIVKLVGRLNWRTSYTQNQWKHAVEVAFLCGMLASELDLDVKLARRAALMHDIGKSLTHAIDGSHAVIGADYARRLGEAEIVANAIGAHHADEPCNSVYAHLVAAADAMSGGRPGARREQNDNYIQRVEDLERLGSRYQGVERAFAVQGGRELRIYVKEDRVSDERCIELSAEIAAKISDELVFPGQIRVTVIREMRASATAS